MAAAPTPSGNLDRDWAVFVDNSSRDNPALLDTKVQRAYGLVSKCKFAVQQLAAAGRPLPLVAELTLYAAVAAAGPRRVRTVVLALVDEVPPAIPRDAAEVSGSPCLPEPSRMPACPPCCRASGLVGARGVGRCCRCTGSDLDHHYRLVPSDQCP